REAPDDVAVVDVRRVDERGRDDPHRLVAPAGVLGKDLGETERDLLVERLQRAQVDVTLEVDVRVTADSRYGHALVVCRTRTGGRFASLRATTRAGRLGPGHAARQIEPVAYVLLDDRAWRPVTGSGGVRTSISRASSTSRASRTWTRKRAT